MGYYIQGPTFGKAQYIVNEYDGKIIPCPEKFSEIPEDKALISVVANPFLGFDAAGYCYSEREFVAFTSPTDNRPKTWLVMDKKLAEKLSDFSEKKV